MEPKVVGGTGRQSPVQGEKALFFPFLGLHAWKTHVATNSSNHPGTQEQGLCPQR